MQLTALVYAAIVAGVTSASALPDPVNVLHSLTPRYCHLPGQPCSKLKRAAEAAANALAEPAASEVFPRYCHLPGQPCSKAKRAAEALAEAVADAHALASPDPEIDALIERYASAFPDAENFPRYCHLPGQPCSKRKRAAEAEAEAAAEAYCHLPGQPCSKVKRGAEAAAEAEAYCHLPGQPCSKNKRAAEAAAEAEAKADCDLPGQPCNKIKRAAEAIAEALAAPEAQPEPASASDALMARFVARESEALMLAARNAVASI